MGTFIGAMGGAATVMIVGKAFKGRDFLGLAVALFLFGVVLGMAAGPFVFALEYAAGGGPAQASGARGTGAPLLLTVVVAVSEYFLVLVPGLIFVALSSPAEPRAGGTRISEPSPPSRR